jgi:hypothetical protein
VLYLTVSLALSKLVVGMSQSWIRQRRIRNRNLLELLAWRSGGASVGSRREREGGDGPAVGSLGFLSGWNLI